MSFALIYFLDCGFVEDLDLTLVGIVNYLFQWCVPSYFIFKPELVKHPHK